MVLADQDELDLVALSQTSKYLYSVCAPRLWGVMMPSLSYNHRYVLFEQQAKRKLMLFHDNKGSNNYRDKLNRQMRSREIWKSNTYVTNVVLTTPNFDQKFLDIKRYPNVKNVELVVKGCGSLEVVRSLRVLAAYMSENPHVLVAIDAWCHVPLSVESIVQSVYSLDIYEFPEEQVLPDLPLRQLRLTNSDSTKPSLAYLAQLQGLEFLEVPGISVGRVWTEGAKSMPLVLKYPNLTHLRIKCIRDIPHVFLNSLDAPQLTVLELFFHFTHVPGDLTNIVKLKARLTVSQVRLADIGDVSDLTVLRKFPKCREVTIMGRNKFSVETQAPMLMQQYKLDVLRWERLEGSSLVTTIFKRGSSSENVALSV